MAHVLLGWMRDYSGGFDLGWHVIMGTTIAILCLLLYLKRYAARQDDAGPIGTA
jgi:hypothetical protein